MAGNGNVEGESVAIVAVPFPAQGHLNQMLHLSLQLAAHGVDVHYAAPPEHVRQARERLHGWDAAALLSVQFHELEISAYVSLPPDPTADSPFPTHLLPMWEIYTADAHAPLAALLGELSASRRRVVVVYDMMNSFAAEEAARFPNGEAFGLQCTAVSSIVGHIDADHRLLRENGFNFRPVYTYTSKEFTEYAQQRAGVDKAIHSGAGIVCNASRSLDGEFIDVVADMLALGGKKLFTVGPLNPLLGPDATASKQRHECLDWLDEQPPASVLYVSFGSMSSLRLEQIAELAAALHGSRQRFIWVLRDADRANIFANAGDYRHAKLLAEFSEKTQGTGLVITGWAPQLEILAHGATAAFMSHCGWNSTMESMSHGKPILAWPMHSDQPWDADLVCKYLKAGILVRPWEKHGEVIPAAAIQEVIETVMATEKGLAVQQRAKAIGEVVRSAAAVGGSSHKDLEAFIAHVTR